MATMIDDGVSAVRDVPSLEGGVRAEEWRARVDLAAMYRLVQLNDWTDNIYNHASMRVPGEPDYFLVKAHPLLWNEVTASNLVKVNMHEELNEGSNVNRPGFVLHSGVLRARPDVNAVLHIHPDPCVAVSAMEDGLLPLSQTAVRLYGRVAYHDYEGITENADERERIIADLGDKPAMLMRNHGATTMGKSVRDAYVLMLSLINACEIQLDAMASGRKLVLPPPEVCESTVAQYEKHDSGRGQADWPGYLRQLDRIDPSYRN